MDKWKNFNEEEKELAKNASLTTVARYCGYTPIRINNVYHKLEEHDSVMIKNDHSYCQYSKGDGRKKGEGGTAIDFVMNFVGSSMVEAVQLLCEIQGYSKDFEFQHKEELFKKAKEELKTKEILIEKQKEEVEFILPEKADRYNRLYAYLEHTRMLSSKTIDFFVKNDLIYQSKPHNNIIFLGKNSEGEIKFASQRGTVDIEGKKSFKVDVAGNDKNYGVNIRNLENDTVHVFEAGIDMMSFCELYNDYDQTNKIALGMVADNPLVRFLEENPHIKKIVFCLDNDEPGQKSQNALIEKYNELGYFVSSCNPIIGKDFNDDIKAVKEKNMNYKEMLEKQKYVYQPTINSSNSEDVYIGLQLDTFFVFVKTKMNYQDELIADIKNNCCSENELLNMFVNLSKDENSKYAQDNYKSYNLDSAIRSPESISQKDIVELLKKENTNHLPIYWVRTLKSELPKMNIEINVVDSSSIVKILNEAQQLMYENAKRISI